MNPIDIVEAVTYNMAARHAAEIDAMFLNHVASWKIWIMRRFPGLYRYFGYEFWYQGAPMGRPGETVILMCRGKEIARITISTMYEY